MLNMAGDVDEETGFIVISLLSFFSWKVLVTTTIPPSRENDNESKKVTRAACMGCVM